MLFSPKRILHSAPKKQNNECCLAPPSYARISGAERAMQILRTNFIGLFSKLSEVFGLSRATPSRHFDTTSNVNDRRGTIYYEACSADTFT